MGGGWMVMKYCSKLIIMLLTVGQTALSATSDKLFYRLVAETNTTITGWTASGDLTWTNSATNIAYTIQATSDLGNSLTSFWGAVETGQVTNQIMTSRVAKPETPFPFLNSTVLIPAGEFIIGNIYSLFGDADYPAHTIRLPAFYMDTTEVTKEKWDAIIDWATNNGYVFEGTATGIETNFPITNVSWHDCIKWCNARSEKEGYNPVYFTDEAKTIFFKTGTNDLSATCVNWLGNGYRLPTEAEWEKAARGGLPQNYYPWPSPGPTNDPTIYLDPTNANYASSDTIAVGSFYANAYGLFDMSGNVYEWCWDYWDWYYNFTDLTGPNSGTERVIRGGAFSSGSSSGELQCSARDKPQKPGKTDFLGLGFRCVRSCP